MFTQPADANVRLILAKQPPNAGYYAANSTRIDTPNSSNIGSSSTSGAFSIKGVVLPSEKNLANLAAP